MLFSTSFPVKKPILYFVTFSPHTVIKFCNKQIAKK